MLGRNQWTPKIRSFVESQERARANDFQRDPQSLDRGYWFVAMDGGIPVGYAAMRRVSRKTMMFTRGFVLKTHRGLGIHDRMIEHRKVVAGQVGAKEIVTFTMRHNVASTNNLIDCGFRMYKPRRIPHAARWSPIYLKYTFKE